MLRGAPRSADGTAEKAIVEPVLRQWPEIPVAAGKRPHPAVFELLGAPDLGQAGRIRPHRLGVPAHGGVHVEECAIGVEGVD